jgi:formylglycine-generating enzyme required for sulfatase activity
MYPWYPWGNVIDGSMANFLNSYDPFETGSQPYTTPVGYYDSNQTPAGLDRANGYGLYDMAGNVMEWCNDWYDPNYYSNSPGQDPHQRVKVFNMRVFRGGDWNHNSYHCRISNRNATYPGNIYSYSGFRICRNYEE